MANTLSTLSTVLSTLSSSGVSLNSLIGQHSAAQTAAESYITGIVSNSGNAAMVIDLATQAQAALGATNPTAGMLLSALKVNANNPASVIALAGRVQAAMLSHSAGLLSGVSGLTAALGL